MSPETISVIGLGYVGLPVAVVFGQHRPVIAFDINTTRLAELRKGHDRTGEVSNQELQQANLSFTDNPKDLRQASIQIIAVPTPINEAKQQDSMTQGRLGELLALLNLGGDRQAPLIWLSGLLVFLLHGKALVVLGINNLIIRFAQNQQIRLRSRLMHAYQQLPYQNYLQHNSAEYIHSVHQSIGQFQDRALVS